MTERTLLEAVSAAGEASATAVLDAMLTRVSIDVVAIDVSEVSVAVSVVVDSEEVEFEF